MRKWKIEISRRLLESIRFELAKNGNEDAIMLVDRIDNILPNETGKVNIVEGKIVEISKPNEIYLALFNQGSGWQVSGVMYYKPDDVVENLAAFNPMQILIVKVEVLE